MTNKVDSICIGHVGLGDMGSYAKPLTKILTNVVDTLGNKIGALPNKTQSITAYHASPKQIIGDFNVSSKDVGTHFAQNPYLAVNAAVKSSMDSPFAYDEMQPFKFGIDANPENVVEINSGGGRFDFYDILEDLLENKKISQKTFEDTYDTISDIENKVSDLGYEEMMQKQNKVFSKMLVDKENIKVLKYFNEMDAGPTWRELQEGDFSNQVKPDYSYMVLDPKIIKPIGNDKISDLGALPSSNFNDLRKGATIRIDNPPFLDAITNETYVAKKIRENNEFKKLNPSDDPIGTVSGVTGFANNVKFSPQELIGIKGHAGEEKYRESGRRMELLKESIAKEGYRDADKGGERILIHVREDGVPFITEGNHRMVEAFQSNRPFISADVRYLRGAEEVDGLLNPKRIGLDFGEE